MILESFCIFWQSWSLISHIDSQRNWCNVFLSLDESGKNHRGVPSKKESRCQNLALQVPTWDCSKLWKRRSALCFGNKQIEFFSTFNVFFLLERIPQKIKNHSYDYFTNLRIFWRHPLPLPRFEFNFRVSLLRRIKGLIAIFAQNISFGKRYSKENCFRNHCRVLRQQRNRSWRRDYFWKSIDW